MHARRLVWLAPLAALAATGCGRTDRVESCAQSLAGQWTAADGARAPSGEPVRFDVIDHDTARLEIYPMFDDSVPPDGSDKMASDVIYAPASLSLHRGGPGLEGEHLHRRARDGVVCIIKMPASGTCSDDRLTLTWATVAAVDWTDCSVTASDVPATYTLRR